MVISMKISAVLKSAPPFLFLTFFAINASAAIDNVDILDNVLQRYADAASTWGNIIQNHASWLFWVLVIISMVWTFGIMALRRADMGEFFAEFIRFTIFTGFFWWLLINGPRFATDIINSLRQIGGQATGLGSSVTPSNIVDIGFEIFGRAVDQSSMWSPASTTVGILMAAIILIILALIGVNMLLLLVSGWLLAYGGIFFLGFGGSRWTSDIAINYYRTVLGIAAQLLAMILLIGIGKTFLDGYYTQMSQGIRFKEIAVMLVVAVVLLALVNKVPPLIAGIVSGAALGIGNFGASAALGAAGMATATAATGRAMMLAGAANMAGGASALMAAFQKAQENMATGSLAGPGSTGSGSGAGSGGLAAAMGGSGRNPVRLLAATSVNLAAGVGSVATDKAKAALHDFSGRVSETVGGRIASAIRDSGGAQRDADQPADAQFNGDSLSAGRQADSETDDDEVAAFVNKKGFSRE